MELYREMDAAPLEDQLQPNQFTYNALIGVLTYSGRMDLAGMSLHTHNHAYTL
jgi:hypothetical protein